LTGQLDAIEVPEVSENPANLLASSIKYLVNEGAEPAIEALGKHSESEILHALMLDHELTALPILAMISGSEPKHAQTAHLVVSRLQHSSTHVLLQQYIESLATGVFSVKRPEAEAHDQGQLDLLLLCFLNYWLGHHLEEELIESIEELFIKSLEA